ncbi:MAG: carboxypeptidase regulatory-like domain-containing protein [Elusimicrobiota bacterium]
MLNEMSYIKRIHCGEKSASGGRYYSRSKIVVFAMLILIIGLFENNADANYQFVTKWGPQGSGDDQFTRPRKIAIDASSYVYVSDDLANRIQKFTSSGTFVTKWGSSGSGDGQFQWAAGVAIDSAGYVYVVDNTNHRVQKFTNTGTFVTKWGSNGSGDGQFSYPGAIVIDSNGNVYISDTGNNRVQKFTNTGTFITKWGSYGSSDGQFNIQSTVGGLGIDANDNIYVGDCGNNRIQKFSSTGTFITKWGSTGTGDGQLDTPDGMAVDAVGNVYVADINNYRVQKFAFAEGVIGKITKTDGTTAIKGAIVELCVSGIVKSSTTTDASGNYSISLSTGTYDIYVSSSQYLSQFSTGVTLSTSQTVTKNFSLTGLDFTYQTDFSANPDWLTNNATNYYWDSANLKYYVKSVNSSNEYAYKQVSYNSGSFKIEYDCNRQIIAFRLGLNTKNVDTLGSISGIRAGFGLNLNKLTLDYALLPYGDLGTTHRISMGLKY